MIVPIGLFLAQASFPETPTLDLWLSALAILTTIVSSILLHVPERWGPWAKRAVVAVVSLVFAAGGVYYEGRLDTSDLGRTWLIVFLAATAIYTLIMKPIQDAVKGAPQT